MQCKQFALQNHIYSIISACFFFPSYFPYVKFEVLSCGNYEHPPPCNLVARYLRFRATCFLHLLHGSRRGGTLFITTGAYLPVCKAAHPTRLQYSYLPHFRRTDKFFDHHERLSFCSSRLNNFRSNKKQIFKTPRRLYSVA